jgi:hypothetical protein
MATVVPTTKKNVTGLVVISILAGEPFFVKDEPPQGTKKLARVKRTNNQWYKLTAKKADLVAVVFELNASKQSARRVCFIRAARIVDETKGLDFFRPIRDPQLRNMLAGSGPSKLHALGGFQNAIVYSDEFTVADHDGAHGWIVPIETLKGSR